MNDLATLRSNLASYLARVSDSELAALLSQLGLELWRRGVSGNIALHRAATELDHRVRFAVIPHPEPFGQSPHVS
jgi:hypothetical protein